MLAVMRDPNADPKRRDAMAVAAAAYLPPKLSAIDAKLTPAASETSAERPTVLVEFRAQRASQPRSGVAAPPVEGAGDSPSHYAPHTGPLVRIASQG